MKTTSTMMLAERDLERREKENDEHVGVIFFWFVQSSMKEEKKERQTTGCEHRRRCMSRII